MAASPAAAAAQAVQLPDQDVLLPAQGAGLLQISLHEGSGHFFVGFADLLLQKPRLVLAPIVRAEADGGAGLIDHVDGLVGQIAVVDIAHGQIHCHLQRLLLHLDPVMLLIDVDDPLQDPDRLLRCGLLDLDRLEPALQGGVLLHIFAVLGDGRRSDQLDLAAGQGGLEDVGGIQRPLRAAGPDQGVQLIDKENDILVRRHLFDDALDPLLELAAVLGARDHAGQVQGQQALAADGGRDLAGGDPASQALYDSRLAHAGLSDEDGIVLGPPAQDLDDAADLLFAPDHGVELSVVGHLGQVPAELVQDPPVLRARGALLQVVPVGGGILSQRRQQFEIDLGDIGAHGLHDLGRHILLFQNDGQEDMLRPCQI